MKNNIYLFLTLCFTAFSLSAQNGETYTFDHEVKMEMKQHKGDEVESTSDFTFLLPEDGKTIGMIANVENKGNSMETKAVFNIEDRTMITLMDQGGMKMGMKMNLDQGMVEEEVEPTGSVKKTGRTREILGYTAEEYELMNEGTYSLIWITDELELTNYYESFASLNKKQDFLKQDMPQGFLLEMTAWPEGKDTEEKYVMTVTEVNENKETSISTDGYRIMQMPTGDR